MNQTTVGQDGLMLRLQKGAAWLKSRNALLFGMEHVGRGSQEEGEFLEAIELWDALDYTLRFVYDYKGCSLGEGKTCPDTATVRCRDCGEMEVPSWRRRTT